MLDEEMDDMIRRAAENHHPTYNDKAWEKMEMQLDKHLPQKKDRKKLIFFLLFFLLLGGGLLFTMTRFMGNKDQVSQNEPGKQGHEKSTSETLSNEPGTEKNAALVAENSNKENAGDQIAGDQPGDNRSTNTQSANNTTTVNRPNGNKAIATFNDQQQQNEDNINTNNLGRNKKFTRPGKGRSKINITAAKPFEELAVAENGARNSILQTSKNKPNNGKTKNKMNVQVTAADPVENAEDKSVAPNSTTDKNEVNEQVEAKAKAELEEEIAKKKKEEKEKEKEKDKEKEPAVAENKSTASIDKPKDPEKKKTDKKFTSNFGLTFSVGPDASFVSLKRFGKINLTYGAGLSYNFAKRLTVRTGFYFTKKIYTASPEEYHTPGGNYPHLTGVDANCKVYEIPLSLAYSFGQRKKHNWFGNVGLSSFIMKKEDYTYNYKNYGQTYTYYKEVNNENKHYFSVLTLSGGYNYRVSKRVSIQAEPYLQLPLSGIGAGKIKLNSTGVLFTVTVKPFAKKK
ncbi:MAG: hypothetical protein ABIR78_01960 [Ferruginibacter sp.]